MPRPAPIVDTGDIKIFKQGVGYLIYMPNAPEGNRKLEITEEELFDLTDELDDICVEIEDGPGRE